MRRYVGMVWIALVFSLASAQELTVWTHLNGAALEWLEQEVASFSQNFKIDVKLEQRDISEIKQSLLQNPREAADIIVPIAHDQIEEMLEQAILLDFKPLSTVRYLADYAPQTRLAFQRGRQVFALPLYIEGAALIANNDVVPEDMLPELSADIESFVASAQALTTAEVDGFLYDIGNFYFSYVWFRSAGGYVFARNDDGTLKADTMGLANAGAVAGARFIQQLRYDYQLIPKGVDYSVADNRFREGKLALIYNGPWALDAYKEAGIAMTVLPMPTVTASANQEANAGFMGVYGVAVNATREQELESVSFAKWLAREASQRQLAQKTGYIPARLAAAEASDDALVFGFAKALRHAEPMPYIPAMGNVWAPMSDALSLMLDDEEADVADLLARAVRKIQD